MVQLTHNSVSKQRNSWDPRKFLKVEEVVIFSLNKQAWPRVQTYRDAVRVKQDKQNPFPPGRIHTYSYCRSQA